MVVKNLGRKDLWVPVGARHLIPPHEQMPVIEFEELVVHVVIGRCTESHFSKDWIPAKGILGVNECQPTGVRTSKGHVRPYIDGSHNVSRRKEGSNDHTECVGSTSVEGIKHARVDESVMGFVGCLVKGWRDNVFEQMHNVL